MEALAKITPGEELEVVFIRDGETKTVKVKFE
jgi:S1-C subfamily serine protease